MGVLYEKNNQRYVLFFVFPIAIVIYYFTGHADTWLASETLQGWIAGGSALITGALSWMQSLGPRWQEINNGLDSLQKASTAIANARQGWINARQSELGDLTSERELRQQELDDLSQQVTELRQQEADLNLQLKELREGRGLEDFLMQRAGSADYQEQLGIVSLVHEDMKSLQRKLSGGLIVTKSRDGETGDEEPEEEERTFDRVVLYVDDLDRCTPDRVVEVLQAIHLLLSIPLFVVVVAADARWLLQCLRTHYSALLNREVNGEAEEWSLTPQNYLEKIFQIPFSLPPMTESQFPSYVEKLLAKDARPEAPAPNRELAQMQNDLERKIIEFEKLKQESPPTAIGKTRKPEDPTISTEQTVSSQKPDETGRKAEQVQESEEAAVKLEQARAEVDDAREKLDQKLANQKESKKRDPVIAIDVSATASQLTVSESEQTFIENLLPLLTTPRITKRLLNVYRLIRVSLPTDEMSDFEAVEHEAVLTLLAIMYSYPSIAAEVFLGLHDPHSADIDTFVRRHAEREGSADWKRLHRALQAVPRNADRAVYQRWLDIVGRFSFEVARSLQRNRD